MTTTTQLGVLGHGVESGSAAERNCATSRVGGVPAWLDLGELPSPASLQCGVCQRPMALLAQVYTPEEAPDCFHRLVYVFCCKSGACYQHPDKCFAVLSCHVGEDNVWYDADGDLVGLQTATKTAAKQLCVVCGGPAPNKCGKCHGPGYCSREHQKAHWNAIHRDLCTKAPPTSQTVLAQQQQALRVLQMAHLFPSYEISLEEEALSDETEKDINDMLAAHRKRAANARDGIGSSDEEDDDDDDDDDDDEKSRLEKKVAGRSSSAKTSRKGSAWKSNFDEDTGNGVLGSEDSGDDDNNDDDDDDDDDEPASEVDRRMDQLQLYNSRERDEQFKRKVVKKYERKRKDRIFLAYQRLMEAFPEQILRYPVRAVDSPAADPVWLNANDQITSEKVPACANCGGARQFEFQLTSQLLSFLDLDHSQADAIDWGTLAIYTCAARCSPLAPVKYLREFLWMQNVSADEVVTKGE